MISDNTTARHALDEGPTQQIAPSYADVVAADAAVQDEVARTTAIAEQRLPRRVERIAREAGGAEGARVAKRIGLVGAVLVVLFTLAFAAVAYNRAGTAVALAEQTDRTVSSALQRLGQANNTLQARGQATVPVPAPSSSDPTPAIAAAVLAQVLASLPPSPTAGEVADRIQGAVVASLIGPSQDELTRQVSAYFARNPPIPGPPPSEAAIRAAVDAALSDNPPPPGPPGPVGEQGLQGGQGVPGADSTVPGPQGPAGPTCPAGTSLQLVQYGPTGPTGQGCVDDPPQ